MGEGTLRTLAAGVHVLEAQQRFQGLEVGARMTVLETNAGVLVHGPLNVPGSALGALGAPRWVVAPNKLHHLHVGRWMEAGAEAWAAPGLAEKRPDLRFAGCLDSPDSPFGEDIGVFPLRCFRMTNEVVLLHRPSRTLVVTDLVFNFAPTAPWATRAVMAGLGGYPGCRTTLLERLGFDRAVARPQIAELLSLDFDRLVLSHGEVIETGGRAALAEALGWLGAPAAAEP